MISASKTQRNFCPGQGVRWCGRLYRVQWCDGVNVGITAGVNPYQCYYEHRPGTFEWNQYVVPVSHIFLQAL